MTRPPPAKARPIVMIGGPFPRVAEVLDASALRYVLSVQRPAIATIAQRMARPVALIIAARDHDGLPTVHVIRRLRQLGAGPVILVVGQPLRDADVFADALRAGADAVLVPGKATRTILADIVRWIAPSVGFGGAMEVFADAPDILQSFLHYGVKWEYWDAGVAALGKLCGVSRRNLARYCAAAGGPPPHVTLQCARLLYTVSVRRGLFTTPDRLAAVAGFSSTGQMAEVCQARLGSTIAALPGSTPQELRLMALKALYPSVGAATSTGLANTPVVE